MPAARVLATQQARDAAKQLLAVTGRVKEQVGRVLQHGGVLADPTHWDGGLAGRWRNDWGQDSSYLRQTAAKLDELEHRAQQVIDNIFTADGTPLAVAGGVSGNGATPGTFDDPIALGTPATAGYANDPVNTATGNFIEVEVDLPGRGLLRGLRFARTFNSRSDGVGPFGRGWTSWASARLRAESGWAAWESPDGQRAMIPVSAEGYQRVAGIGGVVVPGPAGLALEWFGGARWEFDADGLPLALHDGPGTQVRFIHEEGRLVGLRHQGGKRVELIWDGDRISELVCSDGSRVSYRYDNAGNLVEVGGPRVRRCYELDADGRVIAVIDADGVVEVRNTYDAEGRVIGQTSRHGRQSRIRYLPGQITVVDDEHGGPVNTYLHDEAGRLVSVVDGHGAELTKVYDQWGNPVAVTDRNGATTWQEWDDRARLVRQLLPSGLQLSFSYDGSDRLVERVNSTGATTRYRYEGEERAPVEIIDPEGAITRVAVEGGLVRRIVDPDGVAVRFGFDVDGYLTSVTDTEGNARVLERDSAGQVVALVSPTGRRTELRYEDGRPVEQHDPAGGVWWFEYTTAGRLAATIDPTGARTELRYGANGEAEQVIDMFGYVTTRRFDPFGNLVGMVLPDGAKWTFDHDALCRLVGVHDPAGATWLREHDPNGNLIGSVDPKGVRRSAVVNALGQTTRLGDGIAAVDFELDELGRVTAQRRADGTVIRMAYDRCDRPIAVTDPLGRVTRFTYTPAGRLAEVTSPLGHVFAFEYDRCGRVAAEIDPLGHRRSYRHDAEGRVIRIGEPTGEAWWFRYDEAGRLVERHRPGRGTTRYAQDAAGRVVAVTDPGGGVRRFRYDLRGQLVEAVDANGGVTRYTYNEREWLTSVTDAAGGTVEHRYDEVGRVVATTDSLGRTTTWEYDPAGQLVHRVDATGCELRWWYDGAGRVVGYGSGPTADVTIERDPLGRPVIIDEPGMRHQIGWDALGRMVQRRRKDLALTWRYDADGRTAATGYPDGTETTFGYDAAGRLTSATHPALGDVQLRHDEAGRLIDLAGSGFHRRWWYQDGELIGHEVDRGGRRQRTELVRDALGLVAAETCEGVTRRYRYDPAGQLVAAEAADGSWSCTYGYDPIGRLVTETGPAGPVSYTYDDVGQLIERRRGGAITSYTYDEGGRRVGADSPTCARTFAWDALGRLSRIEDRRVSGEPTATSLVIDALGDLATVDGTPLSWDSTSVVSQLRSLGDTAVIGDERPWATVDPAGAASWLDADWQGSVDATGHDPWGAPGEVESGDPPRAPRLGWRGELTVEGLTWLRNRWYDPDTRAFLSVDPLPAVPGTACAGYPYHYAGNDPIGSLDPLGLRPVTDTDLAGYASGALGQGMGWIQSEWGSILGGSALAAAGAGNPVLAALLQPLTLIDPLGLQPTTDQLNPVSRPQITPAAFGIQTAAFAGFPADAPGDGDFFQHLAVQRAFMDRHPGTRLEVGIPGSGPNGGYGRADLVNGNMIWEVKPAKPWWMNGTGQAQLQRYVDALPGVRGTQDNFTVLYGNGQLVVNSYGQDGMLYYYYRQNPRPQPTPVPVPVPAEVAVGAGAAVSIGALVWWGAKVLSPACGPLVLVCAAVL